MMKLVEAYGEELFIEDDDAVYLAVDHAGGCFSYRMHPTIFDDNPLIWENSSNDADYEYVCDVKLHDIKWKDSIVEITYENTIAHFENLEHL